MNVNFMSNGTVQIDNARIVFRNFSGTASKYNRAGDRNFAVVIDDEAIAEALTAEGWRVKIKPPREDGADPFMYLPVKVKFNARGPKVYLKSGNRMNELDEESVSCLDEVEIMSVDMDLRPYDWTLDNGSSGRTAYLDSICVTQRVDRFAERYSEVDDMDLPM